MFTHANEVFGNLTRNHASVCAPPEGVLMEEIAVAIVAIIGDENVCAML